LRARIGTGAQRVDPENGLMIDNFPPSTEIA
jgi:hypothetical protein